MITRSRLSTFSLPEMSSDIVCRPNRDAATPVENANRKTRHHRCSRLQSIQREREREREGERGREIEREREGERKRKRENITIFSEFLAL